MTCSQADNNLKDLMMSLLQTLGLYAQANNLEKEYEKKELSVDSITHILRKFEVIFSVSQLQQSHLTHSIHPFIILPSVGAPYIARRAGNHFETLTINASNNQWQNLSKDHLEGSGYCIAIDSVPSSKSNTQRFSSLLSKKVKWYQPVVWLSLVSSLTGLAIPLFTMAVYDRVIGGQAPHVLPNIALGAGLALIILVSSRLLRAHLLTNTSNQLAKDWADLTFRRLLNMPLMILSRVGLSNHLARLRNSEKVRTLLSGPAGGGLIDLPFTLIAFITIAFLSGWLVLVPIFMLLLFYGVQKVVKKYAQAASPTISSDYQHSTNELAKQFLELRMNPETDGWRTKFARQCKEHCRQNFIYNKRNGLNGAVAHAMSLLTALVTVFTGIFLVLNQTLSPGALIACVMLIWRITGPAQLAFSSSQKLTMLDAAIKQFDRFMSTHTENTELRLDIPTDNAPSLTIKHLTLRFSADSEPALNSVNFSADPGQIIAIIGPNGCGKTALLQTSIGILEPQAGVISLNDKNLRQYDPQVFRNWVGYCAAQPDLFAGSLAQNLRIAKPDATDDELLRTLDKVGAQALLNQIDNDLNYDVFTHGPNLISEVEGSSICLARALLKQPKLLVLDEPVANQNPVVKKAFITLLQQLRGQCTVLFTSHDQDLIAQADKVVILDKGSVVYEGPLPSTPAQTEQESA